MTFVTTVATIFSFASIILTTLEFSTKNVLFKYERKLYVEFSVKSQEIRNMSKSNFIEKIEYRRLKLENEIGKILSVDFNDVELLKPIVSIEGALLTFDVRNDTMHESQALRLIGMEVSNHHLQLKIQKIYFLQQLPAIIDINVNTRSLVNNEEKMFYVFGSPTGNSLISHEGQTVPSISSLPASVATSKSISSNISAPFNATTPYTNKSRTNSPQNNRGTNSKNPLSGVSFELDTYYRMQK